MQYTCPEASATQLISFRDFPLICHPSAYLFIYILQNVSVFEL